MTSHEPAEQANKNALILLEAVRDLLVDPTAQGERNAIADLLSLALQSTGQVNRGNQADGQSCLPEAYTTVEDFRNFFRRNHKALYEMYGARRIHIAMIREFWESRNNFLPGDTKANKDGNPRWWSQISNSLQKSDVFYKPKGTPMSSYYIRPGKWSKVASKNVEA